MAANKNIEEKDPEKRSVSLLWPTIIEIFFSLKRNYDEAVVRNHKTESEQSDGHSVAIWTARLAVFTIILAAISFLTLIIFYCQLRISHDSEQRQLRAYVGEAPTGGVLRYHGDDRKYGISVRIVNSGLTPAYNVSVGIRLRVLKYPYGEASVLKDFSVPVLHTSQTLFPQGYTDVSKWSDDFVSMEDFVKLLVDGKRRIYGFGIIVYDDAFGHPHFTKFCRSFYPSSQVSKFESDLQSETILGERCPLDNDSN